ncbi:hypothetical protein [Desmospora profundinema]|uniref:Uncharacterized protein n=1 Tax=Desmospora profundinema TaxID=1571184 RepID=A0ABU1IRB9_9BACL|nr:hypothetical protein [Desmospora profundinema]MDR6227342.1 hypothetical protein [Desmospora profundinema]
MKAIHEEQQRAIRMWESIREGKQRLAEAAGRGDWQTVERITADLVFWKLEMERLQRKIGLFALFYEEEDAIFLAKDEKSVE